MRFGRESSERHGRRHADLDLADIGLGHLGDHPDAGVIGNAEQLVAGHDALALDDFLLDDVAGRGRSPVDGARVGQGLPHLVDAAVGHVEIAQFLHRAGETAARLGLRGRAFGPESDQKVGLRELNLRAVEAEQRLALADVLAGLVDEQLLDVAVRADGHDPQQRLVVLDGADAAHGAGEASRLDLLGPHS